MKRQVITKGFKHIFPGKTPLLISRAAGRVELIGGHTDYNEGFVIAAAIDRSYYTAASPRQDSTIHLYSEWAGHSHQFQLSPQLEPAGNCHWANYARGLAALLLKQGFPLKGQDLYIHGDVPVGAGLSSSAAMELSLANAMLADRHNSIEPVRLAKICQQAENIYAGTPCGIMDQIVCRMGRKDHAVFLDCRDLSVQMLPFDSEKCCIMIFNSMVRHELADGAYGRRRKSCEDSVKIISKKYHHVKALRDADPEILEELSCQLDPEQLKRSRHIVGENKRVLSAAEVLKTGDMVRFGRLMYQSHCSARDLYEISCDEVDFLVEQVIACDGAYGARLSGGGFGGSVVAIARPSATTDIASKVAHAYKKSFDITPDIYTTRPCQGVEIITS
ncbi:MAG: galactokinase [Planctomycetota bacterium]